MASTALKVLIAAAGVATAASLSFEDYVVQYGKRYQRGTQEWADRKAIFDASLREVEMHNAGNHLYTKGINRFSDWTREELATLRSPLPAAPRPTAVHTVRSAGNPEMLPRYVDWRDHKPSVVTAVKHQGHCGSCWAHAVTESIESQWALATGELYVLSQQQLVSCAPNPHHCGGFGGCQGSLPQLGYEYATKAGGMAEEWAWPYTSYSGVVPNCTVPKRAEFVARINGYTAVPPNDMHALMDAIAFAGPLSVIVDAEPWISYQGGVLDACKAGRNITLDHAVQLVGYGHDIGADVDYWIVRNSWSPAWGEGGYIRLLKPREAQCVYNVMPGVNKHICVGKTQPAKACGMCGILFSPLYPNAARGAPRD